jgi:low affinity Fe/Cu permease
MAKRKDRAKRGGRRMETLADRFRRGSDRLTTALGTPWAMLVAVVVIGAWALSGPVFGFSDTWQLVINTATTIVTFLMVFVIQTSQNRQARATQLKLDELIHVIPEARNRLIAAEEQSVAEEQRDERAFRRAAGRDRDRPRSTRRRRPA